jgi:hypothetical protein
VKLQLSAISDQVCEASDSPDGADSLAGYPVVELAVLEVPEGKIRDIFAAFGQAKDLLGKFDGTRIKGLIEWWKANGDDVIMIITKLFAMFAAAKTDPAPAPVTPPAPTPPPAY